MRSPIPLRFAVPDGPKARGARAAMPSRLDACQREGLDDGWPVDADEGQDPAACRTEVREELARSILTRNDSPDIGFDTSLNPYRGCEHGCAYCFARPSHAWLDASPGLDFETRLVAKVNAPTLLHQTLARSSYRPERLCIGTVTDAYQPIERRYRLTRGLIEVLAEHRHAFSLITKGAGIERDLDLLAPLAEQRLVGVFVSLTTLDGDLARRLEPRAAAPHRRLQTIRRLTAAGVPVGVSVSPTIPFVNEGELEQVLAAARDAGATRAFSIPLRLPWEVAPLFRDWLATHLPDRAERVMARVRDMHGGRDYDPRWGQRFTGQGVWAALLGQRFDKACQRLGLGRERFAYDLAAFRRPTPPVMAQVAPSPQLDLF